MNPPNNPIFVFTDDLTVFHSIDEAAGYHEYRETITAFDQSGRAVQIAPSSERTELPGNHREELIRLLRHEMLRVAVHSPARLNKWLVKHASDDEIIRMAVEWCLIRPPTRRPPVLLFLLAPIVLPISLGFMLLVLVPIACWNASVYSVLWLRWQCFGTPMPRLLVHPRDAGDAPTNSLNKPRLRRSKP